MNDAELRRLVSETVAETLLKMGLDTSDPLELQRDMQHLRQWRESVETVKKQGLITAVGIITAGIIGLIWLSIKSGG